MKELDKVRELVVEATIQKLEKGSPDLKAAVAFLARLTMARLEAI
ncbi:MAG: hypothetical protein NMNS01_24850 [Nitrosomonas sp.]|nr:MAG: hypothetical protein NMNS01_24850 [Nitrosomonas sp.]